MRNSVLNVMIPTNIGEINELKIKKLAEKLAPNLPTGEYNPGISINYFNNDRSKSVGVYPDRVILSAYNSEFISESDINLLHKAITDISEVLMITPEFNSVSVQNNTHYLLNQDSMAFTKKLVSESISSKTTDTCLGAGLRYLYKNEQNTLDEFKFEPLISDSNFIYAEGIYNYKSMSLDKFKESISKNLEDFKNRFDDIISNIK